LNVEQNIIIDSRYLHTVDIYVNGTYKQTRITTYKRQNTHNYLYETKHA